LLRPKFDSVDFVQMVWASFFADPKRIAAIKEPEELIRYLVAMARHKVIDESRRRLKFQKHNVHRERPLQDADQPGATSRQTLETPSQIAMAKERWRRLLRHRSERDRRIMELRMNGATFGEISQSLGIHERTAREVLACLAPGSGDQD
jgi:RNA polymerase sigma-70 factor (ECF subfamily)